MSSPNKKGQTDEKILTAHFIYFFKFQYALLWFEKWDISKHTTHRLHVKVYMQLKTAEVAKHNRYGLWWNV